MSHPHYFREDWIQRTNESFDVDICIYGGTSGGIAAAVAAVRRGRSVVVLNPAQHVGGMSSGGLGWTDSGKRHVIGGLGRDFYRRLGAHYGRDEEWHFEPHVAERVYHDWIAEHDIPVRHAQFLERIEMDGKRITRLHCLGGLSVTARVFMDTTYEGDLMAAAGVPYTVGRESNGTYGETLNGVQVRHLHQFLDGPVDPYRTAGDPGSGALPHVQPSDIEPAGSADHRIQAYCFRVCMTDDPALRLDWQKPAGFDPDEYILASRWFNADKDQYNESLLDGGEWRKFDRLCVGHKTDTNNHGPISSDYIGVNYDWPEASYAQRERLFQQHVTYQQGLYWFIAHDESIPKRYREVMQRFGLARDEFTDTGHWPHQLYVREARRMIGDYVQTEHDCRLTRRCEDPVGMGSYQMDSHNCRRFVRDGAAMNEGDVQVPPDGPYGISYRAIVPKSGECPNLAVPVCCSASHIAFGSVRMEPVFMILGESAAIAAAIALDEGAALQDVRYDALRPELEKAGQVLEAPVEA